MLNAERNEILCQIGAGSSMGEFMRRYWVPILLAEELDAPDGPPVRVRVFGEDLVAYRATTGVVGLLGALCPHRGAPLFFGRNENEGLRCMYHGWKFDETGQCVDMPNVPPASDFKRKVRHVAYPCQEAGGIVWAYLGRDEPIPLPTFDWLDLPAENRIVSKQLLACNYAQAMEGDFDPSHISFLHGPLSAFEAFERRRSGIEDDGSPLDPVDGRLTAELEQACWTRDMQPVIMVTQTPWGMFSGARREAGTEHYYYRFNHFILPFYAGVPRGVGEVGQVNIWVPVDDFSTMVWRVTFREGDRFDSTEIAVQQDGTDVHLPPDGYLPATTESGSRWLPRRNRDTDYGLSRELERTERFSGIVGTWAQDRACTEGMGAVVDRSKERLGPADLPVIRLRAILIEAAEEHRASGVLPSEMRQVPSVSSIPTSLRRREEDWTQVAGDVVAELDSTLTTAG